jgi:hypothetical protein
VTSCAPKLHQITFQGVSKRADLSPYSYTPVNVREQCSWAQTDDHEGATEKAIALVRADVAKTRVSRPLEPLVVKMLPRTMVVGGGVGGPRARAASGQIYGSTHVGRGAPSLSANRHARTAACYRGCPGVLTVHTSQPDLALADVCAPEMSDELITAQPNLDRELDLLFGLVSQQCADLEREEVPLRRYQEVTLVGRAGRRHGGPAAKELLGNE